MNISLYVEDENKIKTVKCNLNQISFNVRDGHFNIVIDKTTYIYKDFSSRPDKNELDKKFESFVKNSWLHNESVFLEIKLSKDKEGYVHATRIKISDIEGKFVCIDTEDVTTLKLQKGE